MENLIEINSKFKFPNCALIHEILNFFLTKYHLNGPIHLRIVSESEFRHSIQKENMKIVTMGWTKPFILRGQRRIIYHDIVLQHTWMKYIFGYGLFHELYHAFQWESNPNEFLAYNMNRINSSFMDEKEDETHKLCYNLAAEFFEVERFFIVDAYYSFHLFSHDEIRRRYAIFFILYLAYRRYVCQNEADLEKIVAIGLSSAYWISSQKSPTRDKIAYRINTEKIDAAIEFMDDILSEPL